MKSARLSSSERLQRVAEVLSDGRPHSTLCIIQAANVCAVNSCIAELRANGLEIECWRTGDIWLYQLVAERKRA